MTYKLSKEDFDKSCKKTQQSVISAYIKTVQETMDMGFGYSYSCSIAATQSLFRKTVIMDICKKELSLIKIRDNYKQMKNKQRQKFDQGSELSADHLKMFNELPGRNDARS
jgi:hypothetical protein